MVVLNAEKYLSFFDGLDIDHQQKEELIRTLWSFTEDQVDKAFGLHPAQQCRGKRREFNLQSQAPILDSIGNVQTNYSRKSTTLKEAS